MTSSDNVRRRVMVIAFFGAVVAVMIGISRGSRRSELFETAGAPGLPSPAILTPSSEPNPATEPAWSLPARAQESGAEREQQLRERARMWSRTDLPAAAAWLLTLSDADAAIVTDAMLAEVGRDDTPGALALAHALRRGIDDGRVEHMAQIWTEEDPAAAIDWITALPPGPDRDRLLARSALVRVQHDSAESARLLDAMTAGPARDAAMAATIARLRIYDPVKADSWQALLAKN